MPSRDKESYSIQAVENALDVLEALSEIDDDVRISQLSEKLAMNKTSVFRLLATFENRGYVEREERSGKYRLGLSAYEIGQKFLSRMGLLRHARPVAERLARGCNEAVYIAVRRRKEAEIGLLPYRQNDQIGIQLGAAMGTQVFDAVIGGYADLTRANPGQPSPGTRTRRATPQAQVTGGNL